MAYVDPTGSGFLLQLLLGGSALTLIARQFLADGVARLLRRGKPEPNEDDDKDNEDEKEDV